MKRDPYRNLGKAVKIIDSTHVLDILKVISYKTWIIQVPDIFIEILNSNYDAILQSIEYVPNIYFQLRDDFKRDNKIIKATIKAFRKHNRLKEINIKLKPLTKKKRGVAIESK